MIFSSRPENTQSERVAPEIVPPHLTQALDALEARQALEWAALNKLEALAKLMDAQFTVPLTQVKLGLDTIIGLIPGIGDTVSLGVSAIIIIQAKRLGASYPQILRMIFNSFLDWLIGLVPIIGDLFDVAWRSNMRNTDYLRDIMERKWAKAREDLLRDEA